MPLLSWCIHNECRFKCLLSTFKCAKINLTQDRNLCLCRLIIQIKRHQIAIRHCLNTLNRLTENINANWPGIFCR